MAEALKAQLQLKEQRSADAGSANAGGGVGSAGGGGTMDDVMRLAKHFQCLNNVHGKASYGQARSRWGRPSRRSGSTPSTRPN